MTLSLLPILAALGAALYVIMILSVGAVVALELARVICTKPPQGHARNGRAKQDSPT